MKEKQLEKLSISELIVLMEKADKEENDVDWEEFHEELMQRSPFAEINEGIEEVNDCVEKLEKEVKKLEKTLKNHLHVDNKVVVNID